jgi:hypothetical protein
VRTTISIDDDLYRRAKATAARSGQTVSQLIEDAVRTSLRPSRARARDVPPLPTFGSGGLLPGVVLDDNTALRVTMDADTPMHALR